MSSETQEKQTPEAAGVAEAVNGFVSAMIERMSVLETELTLSASKHAETAMSSARQRADEESRKILDSAHSEADQLKSVAEAVLKTAQSEAESFKSHISAEKDKLLADTRAECETLTAEAASEAKRLNDQTLQSVERILEEARLSAEETKSQAISERKALLAEAHEAQTQSETALDSIRAEAAEIIRKAHLESGSIKAAAHTEAAELRAQADFALRTAQNEAEHLKHHSAKSHSAEAAPSADSGSLLAEAKRRHDNILETARTEADQIKAGAQAESEAILVHAKAQAESIIANSNKAEPSKHSADGRADSIDLTQASAILEIDEDSVREAIKDGSLNAVKVDGETRLMYAEVISLLKQAVTHSRQQAKANQAEAELLEQMKSENAALQQRIWEIENKSGTPPVQEDGAERNGKARSRQSTIVEIVQGVEKRPLSEQVSPEKRPKVPSRPVPTDPRFTVVDVQAKPKNVLSKIALAIWGEP